MFDLQKVKIVLEEHFSSKVDNTSIIGYLLTFIYAYDYFLNGNIEIPEIVKEHFKNLKG